VHRLGDRFVRVVRRTTPRTTQPPHRRSPGEDAAILRRAGLRKTAPRVAVLRFLEQATAPLSHGEIHEGLADLGFDRATIYRNLIDLADAGLVSRTDLGDHVWRFEIRSGGEAHGVEHPHFVCTSCGVVTCLPGDAVRLVSTRGAPRAISSRSVEVQVKGHCDACAH
jgi:Fur family ferric uptake transcriptional regulator